MLPFSIAQARALAQMMPGAIRFVGIDAEIIRTVLTDRRVEARARRSEGPIQIGADGLLYAPIERVSSRSVAI